MDILERIRSHAEKRGDAIAVCSNGIKLTYHELEDGSARLATALCRLCGDNRSPIVVYGHKDPMMILCFLACVKSGHAYCPVDVSVPLSRVQMIIDEVDAPVILTVADLDLVYDNKIDLAEMKREMAIAEPVSDDIRCKAEDVFYIIFTSGSTGMPKGVQIAANCLNNYLDWAVTLGNAEKDKRGKVFLNQAPFSFDLSVMDLYSSLACGGMLYTLDKNTQADYKRLLTALEESNAQIWVSTPSFADICLTDKIFTQELLPQLQVFLFCGETLTNATARKLQERFPNALVVNTYGPTESTVAMTEVIVTEVICKEQSPLPVGRVKAGTLVEIQSADGQPVAEGERGEIIILGNTVSTGYFHRPELTEKAFFTCERTGEKLRGYRTGDEGYLRDGMLYYSGRMDLQVKLHGYRIEVEDIENNLLKLSHIQNAVVVPNVRGGKVKSLAAFVVYQDRVEDAFETSQLIKAQLKAFLPEYMIPKKFVFLDQIPMTNNGKANRKHLGGLLL